MDLQREREEDAKREARRVAKLARLADRSGAMVVEAAHASAVASTVPSSSSASGDRPAASAPRKKAFGKVQVGKRLKMKKEKPHNPSAAPLRAGLELRKRHGIRKPSAVMRKTLKKLHKSQGMEVG